MQLGLIGLGKMGGNMTKRLLIGGHTLVVFDRSADAVKTAVAQAQTSLNTSGRIVLRASGTEPVVRVMVESATAAEVKSIDLTSAQIQYRADCCGGDDAGEHPQPQPATSDPLASPVAALCSLLSLFSPDVALCQETVVWTTIQLSQLLL